MDIILGALILGLLILIAVLQISGKPFMVKIETDKHDTISLPQQGGEPVDVEKINLEREKQLPTVDQIVSAVNEIMTGGDLNGDKQTKQ